MAKANKCCHNGLYILQASISTTFVNAIENSDISNLWHKRLFPVSERVLNFLAKKNLLPSVKDVKLDTRVHCLVRFAKRVSFQHHSSLRQESVLDIC